MRLRGLTILLALSLPMCMAGCVSYTQPANYHSAANDHWPLADPAQQKTVIQERFDRSRLEELAGKPTLDDGEEWVYVGKFLDGKALPLGTRMAVYGSGDRPNWKMIVVTFDAAGVVSRIRVGAVPSEIAEHPTHWILMGQHFQKDVRLREPATTQPRPRARAVE